jgi:MerR family transcriptional regulator, thiopeptide resistance regulator
VAATAAAAHTRLVTDNWALEAERRWGRTQAFQESQRRAAGYGPADWVRIQTEAADIERRLAEVMLAGWPADSPAAMDLAEDHRDHLSRWFYACGPDLHRSLGDLYVEDPRFAAHYDEQTPGLARFVRTAIHANADRI